MWESAVFVDVDIRHIDPLIKNTRTRETKGYINVDATARQKRWKRNEV